MASDMQTWMCRYCGRRLTVNKKSGRPVPGVCSKKGKNTAGMPKPHSWIKA